MGDFKREHRYWAIKRKHLTQEQDEFCSQVCRWLCNEGVPEIEAVVVESDWPIYEETWENVQRLAEGRPSIREERDEYKAAAEHYVPVAQALAAHVEELATLLQGAQLGLRWFRAEHPDEDTETDAEFDTQVAVALQSSPATSLARLKAEWQADILIEYHQYAKGAKTGGREPMSAHEWASEVLERARQVEGGE